MFTKEELRVIKRALLLASFEGYNVAESIIAKVERELEILKTGKFYLAE